MLMMSNETLQSNSEKANIVYIAGYGRSGSTLLERLLASSVEVIATGEFCNVAQVYASSECCSCGVKASDCSQWRSFFSSFAEVLPKYDEGRRRIESAWGILLPSRKHNELVSKQFRALSREHNSHILDSSKTTRLSIRRPFVLANTNHLKMIHLVKDGRVCLISNIKGSNRKLAKGENDVTYRWPFLKTLLAWPIANVAAEIFGLLNPNRYIRVRFEDFIASPFETLEKIEQFLEVDLSQSKKIVSENQEIPIAHQIAGNRIAKQRHIKLNAATKHSFGSLKVRLFTILNFLPLLRYGYLASGTQRPAQRDG